MAVDDAPQWLLPAFVRSLKALGTTADPERIRAAGQALIERWSTPDRRFHNLKHVIDMLARVDELADESHYPDIMRIAAWYHGCVFSAETKETYQRNGGEDEVASAAEAAKELAALGVPDATVDRVCALILNLKSHTLPANDMDASALNDADLGTLAVEPQLYKKYRMAVREEYAHIPDERYYAARLAIITRLLDRDRLFSSPLGERWELPARQNLAAEKNRIECALAKIAAGEPLTGNDLACPGGADAGAAASPATPAGPSQGARVVPAPAERVAPPSPAATAPSEARPAESAGDPTAAALAQPAARPEALPPSIPPAAPAASGPAPGSVSSAPSSPSPQTPSRGIPRTAEVRREHDEHATSMETCAEDIDRLLASPRAGEEPVARDRQAMAQAERERMAERLRLKTEEAKIAREARTGEFTPILDEVVEDGAGDL
ncbi:Predicted metal-dependent phosphohydrolase, HD superfamily [Actinomyces denticolens]|uniref:Predicted metal-dependent phosphohydrolase, HD superfamily n=1 Tax=Actinomyces denticolens TaxID=52767 RepID=A0ABY1I9P8_9ACTO|nr:hypothetical protein [Actinomyces denticolens]SHI81619.1 Predicted metal-dependent phosphohydrolase, HD superfamily [Actinomyces denticolens]